MKKILLLLLCSISLNAIAQEITYDEFRTIIPFLVKEDFKSAFEKSDALLKRTSDDDDSDLVLRHKAAALGAKVKNAQAGGVVDVNRRVL